MQKEAKLAKAAGMHPGHFVGVSMKIKKKSWIAYVNTAEGDKQPRDSHACMHACAHADFWVWTGGGDIDIQHHEEETLPGHA